MASIKPSELALLRSFSPLSGMKNENLLNLAAKASRRQAALGRILFDEGDVEKRTFYLIQGTVDLLQEGEIVATIRGGTPEARNPLAHIIPRPYAAVVTSKNVDFLVIDSEFLDVMVTWDQTGSYHVSELRDTEVEDSDDWMTMLLQAKAFHKIPPANIQAVFMRLQRVDVRAGETVIKQGDAGDYFYVVIKGSCAVVRETPFNKDGVKLAELKIGDTFGEEALISEAKRNATVTMLTDGSLMRLGKDDFRKLLNEPFIDWIDYARAQAIVKSGGKWLDVRLPSEFSHYQAEGAINLPLYLVRHKIKTLDHSVHYVVCCDTGRRSSAAAYILSERSFHVSVLKDGLIATEVARR